MSFVAYGFSIGSKSDQEAIYLLPYFQPMQRRQQSLSLNPL
jgi:hypothetical protein